MVWLCKNNENELFAVKQISKKVKNEMQSFNMNYKIGKRELELLDFIYKKSSEKDCENIIKLEDSYEDNNDIWLIFEKGGKSLSSLMFKIKGEFLSPWKLLLAC